MEKIDKLLKRYLKRKVKMTTAVLVAFLISGSLSFASGGASGIGDVLDDQLHDLYLEPGEYTPDEDGNVNMTLINRQDGNKEDMPDTEKYNMDKEEYDKLSDHDKELLQKRRVTIKNVVSKDKMTGKVTSSTLTVTNGENRLYGPEELTVELKDDTVNTEHLKNNAVTEEKINNGAVTDAKIAENAVTTGKIQDKNVTTEKLADGAVTSTQLGDSAVTSEKLATDSVTTGKIQDKNVTTEKLADGAVTSTQLGDSAVTTDKIANGNVTKEKLAEAVITEIEGKVNKTAMKGDVTSTTLTITNGTDRLYGDDNLTVELKNNTVDTAHLKDNAVTTGKIQDKNVTTEKLADGAVTSTQLGDSAVTTDKIANGNVTKEKLSNSLKTKIDEIDNKANIDATNIDTDKYISKLNEGVNIDTPTGKLVKDSDLKKHLDLNYYTKPEVDRISSKSDAALSGVANAVAMANLPQVSSYNDYRHMVSAAYGNYEGQSAISVGLSGISQNNRVTYKVSGSLNTKGKLALGAGIGVMIGKVKTPTIEMPTSIKDKLEKSEKERQDMQVKLSEQKEMVNKQAEQIKDLYEIIKGLKEELKKR